MIMDVWSRFIIQAKVFTEESKDHSSRLFIAACQSQGIDPAVLVLHADNGGPMKGCTMLATLHKLGLVPSFSRSRVSDDNPCSGALFRTAPTRSIGPTAHGFPSVEPKKSDWMFQRMSLSKQHVPLKSELSIKAVFQDLLPVLWN